MGWYFRFGIGPFRYSAPLTSKKASPWYYGTVTVNGRQMKCYHRHRTLGAAENCARRALRTGDYSAFK